MYLPEAARRILKTLLPRNAAAFLVEFNAVWLSRSRSKRRRFPGNEVEVLNCCIAYNKYGGFCVPTGSLRRPAAQRIMSGRIYEPDTISFIEANCGGGDIVHAGTYFGDFLPALSRSIASGRLIWAFEPNPENYRCAAITVEINGIENVRLSNLALGASSGEIGFETLDLKGRPLGGGSHVARDSEHHAPALMVDVDSLDEQVPSDRPVAIVHLDVEGCEEEALKGAVGMLNKWSPALVLEHVPTSDWFSKNILQSGYRVDRRLHHNTVLVRGKKG